MASPRGAEAETWTTLQLAAYLGVSPSFIQRRIRDGIISATMHGPFKWPNFRSYLITTQEVKRVPMEVPLPTTGETLAQRLRRGCDRFYRKMGVDLGDVVNRILELEAQEEDRTLRGLILNAASRRPSRRGGKPGSST